MKAFTGLRAIVLMAVPANPAARWSSDRPRSGRAFGMLAVGGRALVLSLGCALWLSGCGGGVGGNFNLVQTPAPLPNLNLYATGVTSPQGVELANNGVDFISVPTGRTPYCCVKPGASYDITVFAQPTNPRETCIVTDGSGVMGNSGVVTVTVTCKVDTGRFVYVTSRGSNSLAAFAIDSVTGALTPVAGSPIPTGQSPVAIAVDPWTQYAFVANQADGTLSAFRIDAASGLPHAFAGAPLMTGVGPTAVAVDGAAGAVYVANAGSGTLSAFSLDSTSGALAAISGSPFSAGVAPSAVFADSVEAYVYVTDSTADTIGAYTIDRVTRALLAAPAGPLATGHGPHAIAPFAQALDEPTPRWLYVANASDGTVSGYAVDNVSANLTPVAGNPFAAGASPSALAVDVAGGFVYVANHGSGSVSAYRVDQSTGNLVEIAGSPFAAASGPAAIAVEPSGKFLYVANEVAASISVFSIDSATGVLTPVAGSPFAVGAGPVALAVGD